MNYDVEKQNIINKIKEVTTLQQLNEVRLYYVGKNGLISNLRSNIKNIPNEEKKEYGIKVNELSNCFEENYNIKKEELETLEVDKQLQKDKIDLTMPSYSFSSGSSHILEKVIEELEEFYISMGYDVVEGPEVEKDLYNFEMLNLPKGHPARDAQDTFYIKGDEWLLRSQTSPVQVRTMLENKDKTPIRIICPGKTYRRDYDDATHSHQFMQMEGLVVSKDISLSDLKGTMNLTAKKLFGEKVETRFRPSYYPFTEPSVEFDVSCFKCDGKGCNVCKNTGWITIGGAGVVHPNVLDMSGYDHNKYQGFAFGFGIERITMVKYGINDIRTFYTNDLRVTNAFNQREGE